MLKKLFILSLFSLISASYFLPIRATFLIGKKIYTEKIKIALLGDVHVALPTSDITRQQKNDLISALKTHNAYCVIEDRVGKWKEIGHTQGITRYQDIKNKKVDSPFGLVIQTSPLMKVHHLCKINGIASANCEFRINISDNIELDIQEMRQVIAILKQSPLMHNDMFCSQLISREAHLNREEKGLLTDYSSIKKMYILKDLNTSLLEFYAIHLLNEAIQTNRYQTFVICVGAFHITRIEALLFSIMPVKNMVNGSDKNLDQRNLSDVEHGLHHPLNIKEFFNIF